MAKRKGWNLSGSGLELPIALVVLGPLAWFGAYSLTGEDKAVKVAEDLGYTNVQVVDKKPVAPLTRACSASDTPSSDWLESTLRVTSKKSLSAPGHSDEARSPFLKR